MNKAAPLPESPSWGAVLLVCRVCNKRSNGPKDLKAKQLSSIARRSGKGEKPRTRVLLTSCMGLCPKSATAVAFIGAQGMTRIVAVRSTAQLEAALPLLTDRPAQPPVD